MKAKAKAKRNTEWTVMDFIFVPPVRQKVERAKAMTKAKDTGKNILSRKYCLIESHDAFFGCE